MELSQLFADIISFASYCLDPEKILATGGLLMLIAIVFAETGLFFGFLLPGDSLLFTAGLFTAADIIDHNIAIVIIAVTVAAIAGDFAGYWFGRKTGVKLFQRKSGFLKEKHLKTATAFYKKHGAHAIILGRFLPIIRTFAPIIAGSIRMKFRKFSVFNIAGGIIWVNSFILSGYLLAKQFPKVNEYMVYMLLIIGVLTAAPFIKMYLQSRKRKTKANILIPSKAECADIRKAS